MLTPLPLFSQFHQEEPRPSIVPDPSMVMPLTFSIVIKEGLFPHADGLSGPTKFPITYIYIHICSSTSLAKHKNASLNKVYLYMCVYTGGIIRTYIESNITRFARAGQSYRLQSYCFSLGHSDDWRTTQTCIFPCLK